ncbi:MAG: hypothetical protein DWI58_09060 [Chloroflexi bacterium]|nr:MAG: hypothetical protein DWI58_09060 [Chloroflexota bacterium]
MGVMDRMFKRTEPNDRHMVPSASDYTTAPECLHNALTPRWDSVDDMGHEDRATEFVCDSCHAMLTPAEAAHARGMAAERLKLS